MKEAQNLSFEPLESCAVRKQNPGFSLNPKSFWIPIYCVAIAYMLALIWVVRSRIIFPWDFLDWPESPFMIGMMKLNLHLPIYTDPGDMNSFVYSPGLQYLTFALLKPFGLALDVRFCRFVNVLVSMVAAFAGTLGVMQLVKSRVSTKSIWFVTWCIFWLVISTNFLCDVPHPDNIQALYALTVFWLCFTSLETKRFGVALATMCVAGMGVFTKQTAAVCFLGPAIIFLVFNIWGWRRSCLLAAVGGLSLGVSLYLVWLPTYGHFFTLDVLSHQKIEPRKAFEVIAWLLARRRGVLLLLAVTAGVGLWQAGGSCRRFLVCWCAIGFFAAAPNCLAYMKIQGARNNLCLYEIWLFMLAWSALLIGPGSLICRIPALQACLNTDWKRRAAQIVPHLLMAAYVIALAPYKQIPTGKEYEHCRLVEDLIHHDIDAGRKVLVTHGAMFFIHSGVTQPPRDQVITSLEYINGHRTEQFADMQARIRRHYYDRIYETGSFDSNTEAVIGQNYGVERVITHTRNSRNILGVSGVIMPNYKVLVPKSTPNAQ